MNVGKTTVNCWINYLKLFFPFLLLISAFLLYQNTTLGGYVWDDRAAIIGNRDVHGTNPLSSLLSNDFWGQDIKSKTSHKSYRPITVASFRLNHFFHGLHPSGYHLGNVLIYSCTTTLSYVLYLQWMSNEYSAMVASLLFCFHPTHVEAVASLVGRADALCGFFYILALISYTSYLRSTQKPSSSLDSQSFVLSPPPPIPASSFPIGLRFPSLKPSTLHFLLSYFLALCASLSKEVGVTVLGMFVLMEVMERLRLAKMYSLILPHTHTPSSHSTSQRSFLYRLFSIIPDYFSSSSSTSFSPSPSSSSSLLFPLYLPPLFPSLFRIFFTILFLLSLSYFRVQLNGPYSLYEWSISENHIHALPSLLDRSLSYAQSHFWYFSKLLYPKYQCFDYGYACLPTIHSLYDPRNILPLLTYCSLLSLLLISLADRRISLLFGLCCLLLPLVPALNILFPVGTVLAERLLFVPSVGGCLLVGELIFGGSPLSSLGKEWKFKWKEEIRKKNIGSKQGEKGRRGKGGEEEEEGEDSDQADRPKRVWLGKESEELHWSPSTLPSPFPSSSNDLSLLNSTSTSSNSISSSSSSPLLSLSSDSFELFPGVEEEEKEERKETEMGLELENEGGGGGGGGSSQSLSSPSHHEAQRLAHLSLNQRKRLKKLKSQQQLLQQKEEEEEEKELEKMSSSPHNRTGSSLYSPSLNLLRLQSQQQQLQALSSLLSAQSTLYLFPHLWSAISIFFLSSVSSAPSSTTSSQLGVQKSKRERPHKSLSSSSFSPSTTTSSPSILAWIHDSFCLFLSRFPSLPLLLFILITFSSIVISRNEEWNDEMTVFTSALRVCPSSLKALTNAANLAMNRPYSPITTPSDLALARGWSEQAIQLWGGQSAAQVNAGIIYQRQKQWVKSFLAFEDALELSDDPDLSALGYLGSSLFEWSQAMGSRPALEGHPLIQLPPSSHGVDTGVSSFISFESLLHRVQLKACEVLDRSVSLGHDPPTLLHTRGSLAMDMGEVEVAVKFFQAALNKNDQMLRAVPVEMRDSLRDTISPSHTYNQLGNALLGLKRDDLMSVAEQAFLSGLQHDPTLLALHTNLGTLYRQQGRLEEARRVLEMGVDVSSQGGLTVPAALVNNLGLVLMDQGRLAEAERMFTQALNSLRQTRGKGWEVGRGGSGSMRAGQGSEGGVEQVMEENLLRVKRMREKN